jgi:uncharacterized protein (TIGR02391 family)
MIVEELNSNAERRTTMSLSRPLTKELLKKLFLKTLHEIRPGGKLSGLGSSDGNIIQSIAKNFEIGRLSDEEEALAYRTCFELERDGFIWQKHGQVQEFKILSPTGKKAVIEDLDNMKLPTIDIDQLLSRDDLRGIVRDDFNSADYEAAVFKAFHYIEEYVRTKAKEPASSLGVALMSAAFSPVTGKLKHPGAAAPKEQDGLHQLMRGAIAWFMNPSSHRTVPRDDSQEL